jgi:hypothetical protein
MSFEPRTLVSVTIDGDVFRETGQQIRGRVSHIAFRYRLRLPGELAETDALEA